MDSDINNIKKMYDKLTYFDQYGGSLVLFIIITLIVLILISYFTVMSNVQPIINDWPNQRCNPKIMPFAGFITHPDGVSATDYTLQNFNYCTQNILSSITGDAVQPITYLTNSLLNVSNNIKNSIQNIRTMFDKVRTSMESVSEEIMGRLMNTTVPLFQIIISFKDLISKIQGTMTAGLYTLLGSYFSLKSLMASIAQFLIGILVALSVMIAAFWAVPFTWGAAIANTAIFVAISIPLAVMLAFMTDTLKINNSYKIPKVKCFDKNTLIKMYNGNMKKVIDIDVGDILYNNNIVTAKIKVATEGSIMYSLNNVIVSNSHIVQYNNKWIHVSDHPEAIKIDKYDEEFLYCLNTTQKIIEVNDFIYTDWDEIYEDKLEKIIHHIKPFENLNSIHKFLDCGFSKSTKIPVNDGTFVDINKIKINDVLLNGEKVYGIVEIDGSTVIEQFRYNLGKNNFIDGFNPDFNNRFERNKIQNSNKLYHLLTDKNTFTIENLIIKDYNDAIDRFF
jgi:hypothetical protein